MLLIMDCHSAQQWLQVFLKDAAETCRPIRTVLVVFWLKEEQKGTTAAFISAPAVTRHRGAFCTILKLCSVRIPPPHHSFSVTQFVSTPHLRYRPKNGLKKCGNINFGVVVLSKREQRHHHQAGEFGGGAAAGLLLRLTEC